MIGGCCGTTPAPHPAIAEGQWRQGAARDPRDRAATAAWPDSSPLTITPETLFVNVGERTNVTGSARFKRLIKEGDYETALDVARNQVEQRRPDHRRQHGRGHARLVEPPCAFLNLVAAEPDIARVPVMIDSSKWEVIEAGLQCVQGKGVVNSISLKEGESPSWSRRARSAATAPRWWSWPSTRRARPTTFERKSRSARAYDLLVNEVGFPPEDIIFDPNIFAVATGIEEHNNYAMDFIEATREIKRAPAGRDGLRWGEQPVVLLPRQQSRCARRCTRCSSTTPSRPVWTWASSTPASWRSTRTSRRTICASASRTWCSTAATTPPSACWTSPTSYPYKASARPVAGRPVSGVD